MEKSEVFFFFTLLCFFSVCFVFFLLNSSYIPLPVIRRRMRCREYLLRVFFSNFNTALCIGTKFKIKKRIKKKKTKTFLMLNEIFNQRFLFFFCIERNLKLNQKKKKIWALHRVVYFFGWKLNNNYSLALNKILFKATEHQQSFYKLRAMISFLLTVVKHHHNQTAWVNRQTGRQAKAR